MNNKSKILLIVFVLLVGGHARSQMRIEPEQDNYITSLLKARVKLLDNFINRFNYNEDFASDLVGEDFSALYPREMVLSTLFNMCDSRLFSADSINVLQQRHAFISNVVNGNYMLERDTHLYAYVNAHCRYANRDFDLQLRLRYTKHPGNAFSWSLLEICSTANGCEDVSGVELFIPPNNDNLRFSYLAKALRKPSEYVIIPRVSTTPYYINLLLNNEIVFENIDGMYYVFTDIMGWDVFITKFNRSAYNSGWLISDLRRR